MHACYCFGCFLLRQPGPLPENGATCSGPQLLTMLEAALGLHKTMSWGENDNIFKNVILLIWEELVVSHLSAGLLWQFLPQ